MELLAVVWGIEKFRFTLYGKVVYLYTDHQALEPIIKRNVAYRQNNARLTTWPDNLKHFDTSQKHTAGKILALTDCLSRQPTEEAMTEEVYNEEYVINIFSELFKLNHKYGQLLNTDRQVRSTDQSAHMTLNTNSELTNKLVYRRNSVRTTIRNILRANKHKQSFQISTNNILKIKVINFHFTDSKIEKQFSYEYHHKGGNNRVMDIIEKKESPKMLRFIERRKETSKHRNFPLKIKSF